MAWYNFMRRKYKASKRYVTRRYTRRRAHAKLYHFPTKVAVFGAPNVGKTTITRRFTQKDYPDDFQKVTEVYKVTITTKCEDGVSCKHDLSLHDTPGSLRGMLPDLYEAVIRKSDTFIIVFALDDHDSMNLVFRTLHDLYNVKGEHVPVLIVANKSDLASNDEESIQERFKFYKEISKKDYPCIEVSSKQVANFKDHWLPILVELERRQGVRNEHGRPVYIGD
ncbi:GTP-binding protein Rheb homolog 1-like [Hydractinia symbiolongicarpus]|uniref:GTP-binding protein Rheb homolog 1-like n=1 Tax=Hydractinia symbiolongicarpus TaxID=13093 RepID=UPI00254E1BDB|nr:GTP-binding protein Rheb homolog 1-like [Hydractinia symbiolongicarpus]